MTTGHLPKEGEIVMSIDHFVHRGVGADLSSLACHAAIELEGALGGRPLDIGAVGKLASIIASGQYGSTDTTRSAFLIDPTATVVLSQAILDSNLVEGPIRREEELLPVMDTIADRLQRLASVDGAGSVGPQEVEKMRDFCLALSKGISDSLPSIFEESF